MSQILVEIWKFSGSCKYVLKMNGLSHEFISDFFPFSGILEYATLLALKKYADFEQSKMAKLQIGICGNVDKTKVLEVKNGHLESNPNPVNFKFFSKRIDKWAFIVCSIYILMFVTTYMIIALSK